MLSDLDNLLLKGSELAPPEFEPGESTKSMLLEFARVLVIGAGGLGCELLKDLALCGFRELHVVDLDRIDLTNLNRQFLFRQEDIGRYKAEVAAEFISRRVPECQVTAYTVPIQSFDVQFYSGFHILIAGLDNVEARRWLNSMLHSMVEFDEYDRPRPETVRPLIDGGTEGFKGQARLILPFKTACYECTLPLQTPQQNVPICTIAETPRTPEHCIEYAFLLEWEREFGQKKLDSDSPEDLNWVFERALERARGYGIEGVTYMRTVGVVKNVIPAIASTNALISAACAAEALKLATYISKPIDSYFMYLGQTNITTGVYSMEKLSDCLICSRQSAVVTFKRNSLLKELFELLKDAAGKFRLQNPAVSSPQGPLYSPRPPALEELHRHKLGLSFSELLASNYWLEHEPLTVTDQSLQSFLLLSLRLEDN